MAVSSKPVHLNAPAIKLKGIKRAKAELNNNNNNNKNNDLSTYLHIWKKVKQCVQIKENNEQVEGTPTWN